MASLLEEEWLTVKEVARLLNVPAQEIYALISAGQLRAIRIGRAIRIPRRFLEEFVQARAEAPERDS